MKPSDGSIRYSLASAYLSAGDVESAVRELKKSVELDPSLKDKADEILRELGR